MQGTLMTGTSAPPVMPAPKIDGLGFGMAIAGAALFATKGIFIKLAYAAGVGAETVLALRMIVSMPIYVAIGVWLVFNPRIRAALGFRAIIGSALVGMLGYYFSSFLDFSGLLFVTAQYERLVLFTYPFFSFVLGLMFFGDRPNWRVLPGLVMAYVGLIIIFAWNLTMRPQGLFEGTVLVVAAGLSFALYQHLARREMAAIGSAMFTCIAMTAAGVAAITHNTVQHGFAAYAELPHEVWGYGLAIGLLGTVAPSFLLNGAILRIGARATASTAAWGPVLTIVLAVAVLHEAFTVYHAIGSLLVILGSLWFARAERRPDPA
jgi:drug/metabolite transporter (DMT)-like permease